MAVAMTVLAMFIGGPVPAQPVAGHPNMAAGEGFVPCDRQCRRERRWRRVVRPWRAKIIRIAQCESGGRWHIDAYHDGGMQFHPDTWRAAGGSGFAWQASKLEQMYRAVIWHNRIGTWTTSAGWPRCGFA